MDNQQPTAHGSWLAVNDGWRLSIECLVQYQHQLTFMNLVDGHQYQPICPA